MVRHILAELGLQRCLHIDLGQHRELLLRECFPGPREQSVVSPDVHRTSDPAMAAATAYLYGVGGKPGTDQLNRSARIAY